MSEAWALANETATNAGVALRPLRTPEDVAAIRNVLRSTWGDHQLLPAEVAVALSESGNVPYGAFVDDSLVGYVLGWAGVSEPDGLHVHSHQLAALPEVRQRGIGYALKLAQRAQALDQGIGLIRWTFDPLVSRNAWFNLVKLGATADRFLPNFYGEMSDALNAGDRTDRLLVRWELGAPPPGKSRPATGARVLARSGPGDSPAPTEVEPPPAEGVALIEIPREYHELKSRDARLAASWRAASADALSSCFDAGFLVRGFTSDSTYVLERIRL